MTHRTQSELGLFGLLVAVGAAIVLLLAALSPGAADPVGSEDAMAMNELSPSGVPQNEAEILGRWYEAAAEELKQIVLKPTGGTKASRDFRRARAAQLVEQIERIRLQLDRNAAAWVGKSMPRVYRDGLKLAEQQAIEAGVRDLPALPALGGSFALLDQRALVVLAQDTLADLQRASGSMADRAKSAVQLSVDDAAADVAERAKAVLRATSQTGLAESKVNGVIAEGIISGDPRRTIRKLADELIAVHGETVTITDRNGQPMEFGAKYYAQMVARTKTREATVKGRHNGLRAVGIDLVAIVGRISTNPCSAFLGQVFSLSGTHPKYPPYASLPGGGPPFHPNCSKSTRPFIERFASGRQLEQAEGLEDAKALLGKDFTQAGRLYKDLQLHQQVKQNYATTARQLFGPARAGAGRRSAAG